MSALSRSIREHLILPFTESTAPIQHVAWGATIGMFVALTPTVGTQMYIVAAIWMIARYVFRVRFNLPVGVAVVWITNPITVVPFYFIFLKTGQYFQAMAGVDVPHMNYEEFKALFSALGHEANLWDRIVHAFLALFWTFGWPMIYGSLVWAIPLSILTYPATWYTLVKYRKMRAEAEGLTYQDWREKTIQKKNEINGK